MNSTIYERVSIRKYESRPVEDEKLVEILRAGMQAPSAADQQPWEFYLVTDTQKLTELAGISPYAGPVGNAPAAIVVCSRKDGLRFPWYSDIDCAICCENILLRATELGLGTVWLGTAPEKDRMEKVKAILSVPDDLEAFAVIAVGYPAESRKQADRFDESRIHRV